ncbi:unnamed protein product [Brassica rapa]|uniref:Uncharacterized protein n=1 Tax=Brassica campestris TaxID=3711 RepID=A0A8D9GA10_BRACM|nr:unnamed protein product [Brassica rapa]
MPLSRFPFPKQIQDSAARDDVLYMKSNEVECTGLEKEMMRRKLKAWKYLRNVSWKFCRRVWRSYWCRMRNLILIVKSL